MDGTREDGNMGRQVSLDDNHGVKAIVCVGDSKYPKDFGNCRIVHPAVGCSMRRTVEDGPKKKARLGVLASRRPRIPENIIHLRPLWTIATGNSMATTCKYCGLDASCNEVHSCWLCGLPGHIDCAQSLVDIAFFRPRPLSASFAMAEPLKKSLP